MPPKKVRTRHQNPYGSKLQLTLNKYHIFLNLYSKDFKFIRPIIIKVIFYQFKGTTQIGRHPQSQILGIINNLLFFILKNGYFRDLEYNLTFQTVFPLDFKTDLHRGHTDEEREIYLKKLRESDKICNFLLVVKEDESSQFYFLGTEFTYTENDKVLRNRLGYELYEHPSGLINMPKGNFDLSTDEVLSPEEEDVKSTFEEIFKTPLPIFNDLDF